MALYAKRSCEHHDKATREKISERRCPADVSHLRVEGGTLARGLHADQRLDPAVAWRDWDAAHRSHARGELAVGPWAAWTRAVSRGRRLHQRGGRERPRVPHDYSGGLR